MEKSTQCLPQLAGSILTVRRAVFFQMEEDKYFRRYQHFSQQTG
jgi:hypothetical protein